MARSHSAATVELPRHLCTIKACRFQTYTHICIYIYAYYYYSYSYYYYYICISSTPGDNEDGNYVEDGYDNVDDDDDDDDDNDAHEGDGGDDDDDDDDGRGPAFLFVP